MPSVRRTIRPSLTGGCASGACGRAGRPPAARRASIVALAAVVAALGACGGGSAGGDDDDLVAAFYPLQFVTERVAGRPVTNLTPAGAEPHDLELSARDTAGLHEAALVVYLSGFAPVVDAAVEGLDTEAVLDVSGPARLTAHGPDEHAADEHAEDEHADEHAEDEHAADEHADEHADDEHDHGSGDDPHFWLDPTRLADVALAIADRLGDRDPDAAEEYAERAEQLVDELAALDREFADGLADCAVTTLVTSHTAFGYLADRYGFTQVGVTGLAPEADPTPGRLAEVTDFVADHGVTTIYYETLVDPAVAETIASETGAAVAVLDPLEGLADDASGADYFTVMRANLATLQTGQGCR